MPAMEGEFPHSASGKAPDAGAWPDRPYFFDTGLQFDCQRCGACCTGDPGVVRVGLEERRALADNLGMEVDEFTGSYCRPLCAGYRLREHADGRCVFYRNGCSVYDHRPRQCRSFPFWIRNLRSGKAWTAAKTACPGIGKGRRYDREEILRILV
jgi:Fe-S-cluster containining protein